MHQPSQRAPTAARYVHSLCQLLASSGAPMTRLLAGTGLEPPTLDATDGAVSHYSLDRLLQNVESLTDERFPGLRLGHHLNISAHGPAGYAGLTAPTVGAAIEVAVRYFPLITELATLRLDLAGKHAILTIVPVPGISQRAERFVVHTLLASFDVMGHFLVGALELQASLAFPDQPELRARLGATVQKIAFVQPHHSLALPRATLDLPLALADRTAHAQALAQCEEKLRQRAHRRSVAERVVALLTRLGPPFPDLETVAGQIGMSSRTLHRRLQEDGMGYRTLVQEARMDCAKRWLLQDQLSVTEAAYRLGYRDSANFTRAFRQATGMTPTGYIKAGSSGVRQPVSEHPPETDPPARSSLPRNT